MTHRGVLQTWKDTDHRRCKNVWLEILHFLIPNVQANFHSEP